MAWLSGWQHRWPITITEESGNNLSNHQVGEIEVQGSDPGSPNYIDFSVFQDGGLDLRFTGTDGITELSFWIREWNDGDKTAKLWVKIPAIAAGSDHIIYIYGGNASAESASNFDNTFTKIADTTADGCQGVWHFDDGSGNTATDSSGNNFHGLLVNNVAWQGAFDGGNWAGISQRFSVGTCLAFSSGWVELPATDMLRPGTGDFSVSLWAAWLPFMDMPLVGDADTFGWLFSLSPFGNVTVFLGDTSGNVKEYITSTTYANGGWHNIIFSWEASTQTLKIFVDGEEAPVGKIFDDTLGNITTTNNVLIGKKIGGGGPGGGEGPGGPGGGYFLGFMDEVAIYQRSMTLEEARSHYYRRKFANPQPTWILGLEDSLNQEPAEEIILKNDNLTVVFMSDGSGFKAFYLNPGNYVRGQARESDYNNLTSVGEFKLSDGDYHSILIGNIEYGNSLVNWTAYKDIASSKDLYGKFDPFGDVDVPVVKIVSTDSIDIGNDRAVTKQEFTYFFTPDEKGVIKKARVTISKMGSSAQALPFIKFLNFVGVNSLGPITDAECVDFGKKILGFNYNSLAELQAEWTIDVGLTASIARQSLYPNLLPGFTDSGWAVGSGTPSIVDDATLDMSSGDVFYICHSDAYPKNRVHTLKFGVQNLIGTLKVKYGMADNALYINNSVQELDITSNGTYTLQHTSGSGDNWLYVRFEQVSGSTRIVNSVVQYLSYDVNYAAPDGSYLANSNLRNCARIQSSDLSDKRIIYDFGGEVNIGKGKGIVLSILPLDGNPIDDGAFKIVFQKPDDSWAESSVQNIFVDYNEKFGADAQRFNLWKDGHFGISLPDGIDTVKKIGIEWVTSQPIDWLLDGFCIAAWESSDDGLGTDVERQLGQVSEKNRSQDFCLRGVHGLVYANNTTIKGEEIKVKKGEKIPLTHNNLTSLSAVYQLSTAQADFLFSDFTDRVYEAAIDCSSIVDYEYPISVTNVTRGKTWLIKSSSGSMITVDISEEEYAQGDTIQVKYAYRETIDPANYNLVFQSGLYHIEWENNAWTQSHDNQKVFVDYDISERRDDVVGMLMGGSIHDIYSIRKIRGNPLQSPHLLSVESIMVLYDPNNEVAETSLVYYPTKEAVGENLFQTTQYVQDMIDGLKVRSRDEPLSPLPHNYSFIPHPAFGSEYIHGNPADYLPRIAEKLNQSEAANAIVSAGSLTSLRSRDTDAWWLWSASLRGSGVDLISAVRSILRSGLDEFDISRHINRHRYFLELSAFAYDHSKQYRSQASVDYKGEENYKRSWYYETDSGLFTTVIRNWDDFNSSYYDSIDIEGKTYNFRYHYTMVVPAFWSMVTPASDWGINEPTVYDIMTRRLESLCKICDADGIILSEYNYYTHGYGTNELTMYNNWRVSEGKPPVGDWPRFGTNSYVDCDDPDIWVWKSYETKRFLTDMAAIAHSHDKVFGVSVNVQNIMSVVNPDSSVWNGYSKEIAPDGSTCMKTLNNSITRYGTPYYDMLKENICDILYVQLHYKYSAFGIQAVYDFIKEFSELRERMILAVGLFPMDDSPDAVEIIQLVKDLLKDGWNVSFTGYPPMLIQDERWGEVWKNINGYVPTVDYNPGSRKIEVNAAGANKIPFMVRY